MREPVLVVDIGGTKIACGIALPDGRIASVQIEPTRAPDGGEATLQRVIALVQSVRRTSQIAPAAIGIGTAGDVDPATGAINYATATIPNWLGLPIRVRVQNALALPTFVDNDGNVMTLGETIFGAGRGQQTIVGITVGTGIGGGIVIDGRIYRGAHGFAGRIGHIIVDYENRQSCTCGGAGCLEAYAAALPMIADFARRTKTGSEPIGVKEITELAATGNAIAQDVIRRGAFFLGVGIASLVNALNPETVIVGGGVAQIGETYFAEVRRVAHERAQPSVQDTPIVPAQLGMNANLIGAAELAWQGMGQ
jgi:glucokinase